MRRPVCTICNNKVKDNTYYWDYDHLVHKMCKNINTTIKNAVVTLPVFKMGVKGRL